MFSSIINFLAGYAIIEIEGYYIEKFINECIVNEIYLWGIKRKESVMLIAKIGCSDFEKARELAIKNQCIIRKKGEKGIPLLFEKYKKRKVLAFSIIGLLVIVFTLSKFIWNIEIQGTNLINKDELLKLASENGVKIGSLKKKIDTEKVINKIRIEKPDIAWIGIEIKGTNAIIKVVETDKKPEIVDENDFCNIVATKDGKVEKIYAQNGTAIVQEGDTVKKGDILIAGWMEGEFTGKQYVNANGVVKATIKYTKSKKIEKKEIKRKQTGKKERKIAIKFNNFQINFYKRLSKLKKYDTIYSEKKIKLFPNLYLPIKIIVYENYEVEEDEYYNNYDSAKCYGEKELDEEMAGYVSGEITNRTTEIMDYDSYYVVQITYEVMEEIGTKEKIMF